MSWAKIINLIEIGTINCVEGFGFALGVTIFILLFYLGWRLWRWIGKWWVR